MNGWSRESRVESSQKYETRKINICTWFRRAKIYLDLRLCYSVARTGKKIYFSFANWSEKIINSILDIHWSSSVIVSISARCHALSLGHTGICLDAQSLSVTDGQWWWTQLMWRTEKAEEAKGKNVKFDAFCFFLSGDRFGMTSTKFCFHPSQCVCSGTSE